MRCNNFLVENRCSILEKIIRFSDPNVLPLQIARNGVLLPTLEAPTKQAPKDKNVKLKQFKIIFIIKAALENVHYKPIEPYTKSVYNSYK